MIIKIKSFFENIKFILKINYSIDKTIYIFLFLKTLFNSFFPFIFIIFPKVIINAVEADKEIKNIFIYIAVFAVISITSHLIIGKINKILSYKNIKADAEFARLLNKKIMNQNLQTLESSAMLDKLEFARSSLASMKITEIMDSISTVITNINIFIGTLFILSSLGYILLPIIIIVLIINVLVNNRRLNQRYNFERENVNLLRERKYLENVMSDNSFGKEIRLYNLKDNILHKYSEKMELYNEQYHKTGKERILLYLLCFFIDAVREFIIYIYISLQYLRGFINIANFYSNILAANNMSSSINAIANTIISLNNKTKYISDIKFIFELYEFEFKNVSFKYKGQKKYALDNINMKIRAGSKTCVVGANGAGKTTLIKLLLRLYEPTAGEILLNKKNITQYNYDEYLDIFSVIFQDDFLLPFTLEENISLSEKTDRDKLKRTLNKAGLSEKVETLINKEKTCLLIRLTKVNSIYRV